MAIHKCTDLADWAAALAAAQCREQGKGSAAAMASTLTAMESKAAQALGIPDDDHRSKGAWTYVAMHGQDALLLPRATLRAKSRSAERWVPWRCEAIRKGLQVQVRAECCLDVPRPRPSRQLQELRVGVVRWTTRRVSMYPPTPWNGIHPSCVSITILLFQRLARRREAAVARPALAVRQASLEGRDAKGPGAGALWRSQSS